jgi:probable HAF family extracellular repeat protein
VGGAHSYANDINDAGLIAGSSHTADGQQRATLWTGSTVKNLGTLGGTYSGAKALNNVGQVVGYANTAESNFTNRAVLWDGSSIIDLNSFLAESDLAAGWVLNVANDINDKGWIVGAASNSKLGVSERAFLLSVTAVPEPKTYALMLAGLGAIRFAVRRRRN